MTVQLGIPEMTADAPRGSRAATRGLTGAIAILLAASVVGLATTSDGPTDTSVAAATKAAYTKATSARIVLHQTFAFGEVKFEMTGEQLVDIANGRSSASMTLPENLGAIHIVQDGATVFARTDKTKTDGGAPGWVKVVIDSDEGIAGAMVQSVGADPADILDAMADAGVDAKKAGTEQIAGADVTRYEGSMTGDQLSATLSEEEREGLEDTGVDIDDITARYEIGISADGRPRRIRVTTEMPQGSTTMQFDFEEYDLPVDVQIPAAASVVREETVKNSIEFQAVFNELGAEAAGR